MSNGYGVDPILKRNNTPTALERDFPAEVVSVASLRSLRQQGQDQEEYNQTYEHNENHEHNKFYERHEHHELKHKSTTTQRTSILETDTQAEPRGGHRHAQTAESHGGNNGSSHHDDGDGNANDNDNDNNEGDEDSNDDEDEKDTLYFEPKRIYRLEQESGSRNTLVRVYSDTERSNFNDVTGRRMYDDLRYRPIHHDSQTSTGPSLSRTGDGDNRSKPIEISVPVGRRRRYSSIGESPRRSSQQLQGYNEAITPLADMQDEYIPDFDFSDEVLKWQHEGALANVGRQDSNTLSRYNTWTDDDESDFHYDSNSSSMILQSSHAQVAPIPLPKLKSPPMNSTSSNALPNPNFSAQSTHPLISASRFVSPLATAGRFKRQKSSLENPSSSSLTFSSLASTPIGASLLEAKLALEDLKAIARKVPRDFMSLPYTQRKKLLLEIAPDQDHRLLMAVLKKYMLTNGKSSTQLNRSRQGSLASQFLSSFTPSSSFKPDDRGTVILGHRLGKVIGFGAWGMIRECYECNESSSYQEANGTVDGTVDGTADGIAETRQDQTVLSPPEPPVTATKAIKIVKFRANTKVKNQVLREVSIWRKLKHDNILPLLDWKMDEEYAIYCLTEKIDHGTLYDLVSSWGTAEHSAVPLDTRCRLTIQLALQIIAALKYMHSKYFVHGDVKLENCLLERRTHDSDFSWTVLVCDFGMSRHFGHLRARDEEDGGVGCDGDGDGDGDGGSNSNSGTGTGTGTSTSTSISSTSKHSLTPKDSVEFRSPLDGSWISTKRKPTIPKSASNTVLKPLNKLQKIVKNHHLTHDDTPLGISSFPKPYGPALTSAKITTCVEFSTSLSPEKRAPNSEGAAASAGKKLEPLNDGAAPAPHSHIGSLPYAAPELIEPCPPPLGPSADIWALGVTLYTMLTGRLPFKHEYEPRLRAMITSGKYDVELLRRVCDARLEREAGSETVRFQGLFNAVRGCLTKDMTQRWDLEMLELPLREDLSRHQHRAAPFSSPHSALATQPGAL